MTQKTSTFRRRAGGAVAAMALALAASVAGALPASAHTQVTPSAPEPGSTVTTGPVTVAVTATDPILESGHKGIVVKGPDDEELYYGDGCATVTNGGTLSSDVTLGEPGEYTVIWTLVAEDGHQQSSDDFEPFTFTWQPDAGEKTAPGYTEAPVCGEDAPETAPGSADESESGDTDAKDDTAESAAPDATAEGDAPAPLTENDDEWNDIGWLIAAAGIVFLAAALVVLISARRKMLADDDETEDAPADDAAGTSAPEPTSPEPDAPDERDDDSSTGRSDGGTTPSA